MWSIVEFIDEHTIEVVPAHWVKNKKCAWPKKNVKSNIERRTIPNTFDFNYYASRVIKKSIETIHVARAKLKIAEHTSDLSTTEEVCFRDKKKTKIPDPPLYLSHIQETSSVQNDHYNNNFETISLNSVSPSKKCKRKLFDSIINSDEDDTNNIIISNRSPSIKSHNEMDTHSNSLNSPDKKYKSTNYYYQSKNSSCQVLSLQNTPQMLDKVNRQFDKSTKQHFAVTDSNANKSIVYTSSSPFKVTSEIFKERSKHLQDNIETVTPSIVLPSTSQNSINDSDIVKRILQVVLKIRYDVESLAQRLQQMENKIEESSLTKTAGNDPTYIETLNQEDDYESILPLMNEDDLDMFENKLSNRSFRLNVVNGLKRLIRKSLASSIRQIMRKLFSDELLKYYSYVGQKKKKIFSTLSSCTIIFETIRKCKDFQNALNTEIEGPIKIYIAGAAFRKKLL